jgi:RNA polymerase sigma factor (sigma-70 family)
MDEHQWLVDQFEQKRAHLRGVAYRMLGSLCEADDAVQETWLRLSRAGAEGVENLGGWLTMVVARVCLDALRTRKSRSEESLDDQTHERGSFPESHGLGANPEQEALLADSVGLALMVVLDTLGPTERLAFVLHDMFDLSFDEIAPIVGRSPMATRQLASRARRRVRGTNTVPNPQQSRQREVVEAFLHAARSGNFEALLSVLDPDVVLRTDPALLAPGAPLELRGAHDIATRAIKAGARLARIALLNGDVGAVVAPRGHLKIAIQFTITDARIVKMEAIADPDRLRQINLAVLSD